MLRRHRTDLQLADRQRLAHLDLEHRLEPPLAEQAAEAAGHDDRELLAELLERRQVEVVVVRVRDEHGVDAATRARRDGRRAPQVRDAVAQQRIRQQANAVEVDEDRRVPDILDPRHVETLDVVPGLSQARVSRRSP